MAYLKVASSTFEQAFGTGADNMHDSRGNTADRDGLPGSFMTMLTDTCAEEKNGRHGLYIHGSGAGGSCVRLPAGRTWCSLS